MPEDNISKQFFEGKVEKFRRHFELSKKEKRINIISVICKDFTKTPNDIFSFEHKFGTDTVKEYRHGKTKKILPL